MNICQSMLRDFDYVVNQETINLLQMEYVSFMDAMTFAGALMGEGFTYEDLVYLLTQLTKRAVNNDIEGLHMSVQTLYEECNSDHELGEFYDSSTNKDIFKLYALNFCLNLREIVEMLHKKQSEILSSCDVLLELQEQLIDSMEKSMEEQEEIRKKITEPIDFKEFMEESKHESK